MASFEMLKGPVMQRARKYGLDGGRQEADQASQLSQRDVRLAQRLTQLVLYFRYLPGGETESPATESIVKPRKVTDWAGERRDLASFITNPRL